MLVVNLHKQLPDFLLEIQFKVANNTFVLFGPSGSGKTTILRCIAGLTRPDKGYIQLERKVLYDSERKIFLPPRNRGIGYVFQEYVLFPHLTVQRNISYGVKNTNEKTPDTLNKLLNLLKIHNLTQRYPSELSGGEKQRVALARALMAEPKILLLDEPLAALDNEIRGEIQEELLKLKKYLQIPIILVTHDMEEARKLGDQIMFINQGHLKLLFQDLPWKIH